MGGGAYGLDEELGKTLVRTLEPVVGADHVRASVHVEYDLSSSENTEETYDPKTAAALTQQKSEETLGGAAVAGIPGTASNLPGGPGASAQLAPESQSSRSESASYAVSKSVRHIVQPPGRIKRIAAAVLVDDAVEISDKNGTKTATRRKRTPEEIKEIETLSAAAIGLDSQRGDLLAIQNLSFQELPVELPPPPTRLEKTRNIVVQWTGLLRYVGILALFLIVYFMVLRPVKKQIVIAFKELPGRVGGAVKELARTSGAGSDAAIEIELPGGSEQARRASALKRQLTDRVKSEPAAASRLVQSWIREGGK